MPNTYMEYPSEKRIELTIDEKVDRAFFDEIIPQVEAFMAAHGKIRMVEVIKDFKGFEASVLWDGIKFDKENLKHVSHVALVSDVGWISPLSKAVGALVSSDVRCFDLDELEAARAWARGDEPAQA